MKIDLVARAKTFGAIGLRLGRATGRPFQSMAYAAKFLVDHQKRHSLVWKGLPFTARGTDSAAIEEVLVEREYEPAARLLRQRSRPVVLDLGANIGMFSLFVFAEVPDATVLAFEASADSAALLAENAAANKQLDWLTHHGAAWSTDGEVVFVTSASSTAGHVVAGGSKEKVQAWALSSLIARAGGRADLVKLDIEGAEEKVLTGAGARESLARIETLVVEIHPGMCDADAVYDVLRTCFPRRYRVVGRAWSKPLVIATRSRLAIDLPAQSD